MTENTDQSVPDRADQFLNELTEEETKIEKVKIEEIKPQIAELMGTIKPGDAETIEKVCALLAPVKDETYVACQIILLQKKSKLGKKEINALLDGFKAETRKKKVSTQLKKEPTTLFSSRT